MRRKSLHFIASISRAERIEMIALYSDNRIEGRVTEQKLRKITRADFVIKYHQSLWFTPQFKAISEFRQKEFSQAEI